MRGCGRGSVRGAVGVGAGVGSRSGGILHFATVVGEAVPGVAAQVGGRAHQCDAQEGKHVVGVGEVGWRRPMAPWEDAWHLSRCSLEASSS